MNEIEIHPELRHVARFLNSPKKVHTDASLIRSQRIWRVIYRALTRLRRNARVVRVNQFVSVRVYEPAEWVDGRAVLYVHGGGYISGDAVMSETGSRRYAERLGALVAAVNYRLPPTYRFPTPLEDCYAGLQWLAGHPGVDTAKIVVAGESAGGGLAAALAQLAVDRGEVIPAGQLLVYPMLDDRTAVRSDLDGAYKIWNNVSNGVGWRAYTGVEPGGEEMSPYAVPARRDDLTGLPPAWIGVGTADLFEEEDIAYAERLRAAGVPVVLEVVPGAFHGFDGLRPKAAVSRAFFDSQVETLEHWLG